MPTRRPSPTLLAHILLLAVVLVWGTTFTLVKAALADTTPLLFNLLRMTLAAIILAALNFGHIRHATALDLKHAAIAGIFLALGYQFQTAGLTLTTPSKSAFITGLIVVIVPLLTLIPKLRPVTMPRPRPISLLGALIAFTGLILLTTSPGAALFSGIGIGEALTLACALAYAFHLLTLSHAARLTSARTLGTVQIAVAALIMLITLPLGGHPFLHLTSRLILALAITAILATAAAFTIQSWAQQHLSPTHTALIFTLEPVFAWLTALLLLHERLGRRALTGAALILGGILITELWPASSPQSLHPNQEAEVVQDI